MKTKIQISPVRSSDQGVYQCQINVEPKVSRSVVLVVLGESSDRNIFEGGATERNSAIGDILS